MSIEEKDLIVNIRCLEEGIVPISGVESNHVSKTLTHMNEEHKRVSTRKFRKILKKALRQAALKDACSRMPYKEMLTIHMSRAGLLQGARGPAAKKLTSSQRNYRKWMVLSFLSSETKSNTY